MACLKVHMQGQCRIRPKPRNAWPCTSSEAAVLLPIICSGLKKSNLCFPGVTRLIGLQQSLRPPHTYQLHGPCHLSQGSSEATQRHGLHRRSLVPPPVHSRGSPRAVGRGALAAGCPSPSWGWAVRRLMHEREEERGISCVSGLAGDRCKAMLSPSASLSQHRHPAPGPGAASSQTTRLHGKGTGTHACTRTHHPVCVLWGRSHSTKHKARSFQTLTPAQRPWPTSAPLPLPSSVIHQENFPLQQASEEEMLTSLQPDLSLLACKLLRTRKALLHGTAPSRPCHQGWGRAASSSCQEPSRHLPNIRPS